MAESLNICSFSNSERGFLLSRLFLLQDEAPAHKAASVCQVFDQKQNVTTLYHTLYAQDLSPPDYFLFPKFKMKLKRTPLC
jgi:hypothetical protein